MEFQSLIHVRQRQAAQNGSIETDEEIAIVFLVKYRTHLRCGENDVSRTCNQNTVISLLWCQRTLRYDDISCKEPLFWKAQQSPTTAAANTPYQHHRTPGLQQNQESATLNLIPDTYKLEKQTIQICPIS